MARIRSIHPGLMTDESYMSLSMAARVALGGIWMEADDHGVFAWKPLTLKARIFPADNVDMGAILAELEAQNWIKSFDAEGNKYGVCRNFRKWQRPKAPTYQHPFPQDFGIYIGLEPSTSPVLPQSFPSPSPKSPQREEGGWRMKEGEESKRASPIEVSALLSKTSDKLNGKSTLPPHERKAVWQTRICREAQLTMPDPEYQRWLIAFAENEPWAKRKAEEIDKVLKADKARASA